MTTIPNRRTIPADAMPADNLADGQCMVHWHYKALYYAGDGQWLIQYYNCGMHYPSWEAARDKYNQLEAVR